MTGDSRIRILYLIDKLQRAGAQVHLLQLARHLDPGEFDPRVCCLIRGGPVAEQMRALGLEVDILGLPTIYGPAAWRALPRLARSLRERRVQLVHTYLVSANIYGTFAARLAGVPAVLTSRRDTGFSRNWRLRLVEEWLVNPRVDRVAAVSPSAAAEARKERGLGGAKVVTIPNGVDLAEYAPARHPRVVARERFAVAADELALGVIAHLSPVKGHADLLQAMAVVAARQPRVKLFLVGDGVLRQPLEAQARSLGLAGRVLFTGSRDDVADVLAMLDVMVLPSHTEGMSNTLLEAMAMERPVVATAVGGNLDLLEDGVTGLLVPPHDPEALAAAILRLLGAPDEARRLGQAARRRAEAEFGLDRMVARYEALYRDLVHG
jgi:glycosyltransferase involved in cell wall biosynthesis